MVDKQKGYTHAMFYCKTNFKLKVTEDGWGESAFPPSSQAP